MQAYAALADCSLTLIIVLPHEFGTVGKTLLARYPTKYGPDPVLTGVNWIFFYHTGRDDFKTLEQKLACNCPFSLVIHKEEILLCLFKDDS